ncbi:hypothetical protein K0B03_01605 [Patescibacteria group bacterium]|nr:hypothetical protein [Patescibacteria group bacterium]
MITKTYLDGKLNQLEESLKRRIETNENMQTEEIDKKIADLREDVELINEKLIENKDIIDNYLFKHNGLKQRVEVLEGMSEEINENDNQQNNNDIEQITNDLQ